MGGQARAWLIKHRLAMSLQGRRVWDGRRLTQRILEGGLEAVLGKRGFLGDGGDTLGRVYWTGVIGGGEFFS